MLMSESKDIMHIHKHPPIIPNGVKCQITLGHNGFYSPVPHFMQRSQSYQESEICDSKVCCSACVLFSGQLSLHSVVPVGTITV